MIFLFEIIRLGLHNLRLHLLRSVLTSLGIILGVAAVIVMVAIGEGKKQTALREIEALGARNIILRSVRPPESSSFNTEERSFIASFGLTRADLRRLDHFLADAPFIVPLKSVGDEISFREKRIASQAYGTTPSLREVANLRVARGRYLSPEDMTQRLPVAVIGEQVARQLFTQTDPIGSDLNIGRRVFRVIGVLAPIGLAGGAGSPLVGRDLNFDVHIPLPSAELEFSDIVQRRTSGSFTGERVEISELYIQAPASEEVLPTAERIRRIVETDRRNLEEVQIIVPYELLEQAKRETRRMNIMLTAIAAISLLVGGIGIMNIMLASVTERTREIGIRRALGAARRHILAQFLVETGTLASVGGVLGILLGVTSAFVLPFIFRQNLETQITTWSIAVSFVVACSVGLIFGIYPAVVASRQDPIVALRHD